MRNLWTVIRPQLHTVTKQNLVSSKTMVAKEPDSMKRSHRFEKEYIFLYFYLACFVVVNQPGGCDLSICGSQDKREIWQPARLSVSLHSYITPLLYGNIQIPNQIDVGVCLSFNEKGLSHCLITPLLFWVYNMTNRNLKKEEEKIKKWLKSVPR